MDGCAFYDGKSTRRWEIELRREGDELLIRHPEWELRIPLDDINLERVPGGGGYVLHLASGGRCEVATDHLPVELQRLHAARLGWLDFLQVHWGGALLALALCLLLAAVVYFQGLPWIAKLAAPRIPSSIVVALSRHSLEVLDAGPLRPSRLPAKRRNEISRELDRLAAIETGPFAPRLAFRHAPSLGPNAFALPDGQLVIVDDLATLLADDEILAVLAHEMGHVHHRHALRQLIQSSLLATASAGLFGDISPLASGLGTLVLTAGYSRDMELEADEYSAQQLDRLGLSAALLAAALEKLDRQPEAADPLATHPQTQERIRRLRTTAAS